MMSVNSFVPFVLVEIEVQIVGVLIQSSLISIVMKIFYFHWNFVNFKKLYLNRLSTPLNYGSRNEY